MAIQIQLRRGTAAEWTTANPTLAEGEMGLETDTSAYKIGDGTTAWTSLAYSSLPSTSVTLTGTETLTNKTLTAPVVNNAVLQGAEESWNVAATAATGVMNFSSATSTAFYYTSNATSNFSLSFWSDYPSLLQDVVELGDSITFAVAITNGATPYYATAIYVDNNFVTTKWQGGSAPTSGNANSIDLYVVTLIKTAVNTFPIKDDWVALVSQTQFA